MKNFSSSEEIERKTLLILKILNECREPLGARLIARRMQELGVSMSERTVRYHLRMLDERHLTNLVGQRDGRIITETGAGELDDARVHDKVGLSISRIEMLAFRTTFDPKTGRGTLPVNVSIFAKNQFPAFLKAVAPAFEKRLCVSSHVSVAEEGERLGDVLIPDGKVGIATVCSIVINGVLLKAGIPIDSKFGGILQVKGGKPIRFAELIYYSGSSLNPSEAFIRSRMTSIKDVVDKGEGKLLANFREIPAICSDLAGKMVSELADAGIGGILTVGGPGESICQIPVDMNKIGIILTDGLNPIVCAQESGIETANYAMSTMLDYSELNDFREISKSFLKKKKNK